MACAVAVATTPAFGQTQKDVPVAFDKNTAWAYLLKQVDFGPRKPGTDAHHQCRDYIYSEMKKYCANVRLQEFTHTWSRTGEPIKMWNIIGDQGYADAPVKIALFAHWDTRPTADQESDPDRQKQPIPGANDGASGVAVLLELMQAIKDKHPGVGVMFVMVDGEDLGPDLDEMFLGAEYFSGHLPVPKPDYGILLDMIGGKNLQVPREPNSQKFAPKLERLFYAYAAKIGLGAAFPNVMGPEIEDDHLSLNQAGVPTIDLIDFDYPAWHTLADKPDQCSPDSLFDVGKMLESWITSAEAKAAAKVD